MLSAARCRVDDASKKQSEYNVDTPLGEGWHFPCVSMSLKPGAFEASETHAGTYRLLPRVCIACRVDRTKQEQQNKQGAQAVFPLNFYIPFSKLWLCVVLALEDVEWSYCFRCVLILLLCCELHDATSRPPNLPNGNGWRTFPLLYLWFSSCWSRPPLKSASSRRRKKRSK